MTSFSALVQIGEMFKRWKVLHDAINKKRLSNYTPYLDMGLFAFGQA